MRRVVLLAVVASPVFASCGSATTTRTATTSTATTGTATATTTTATPAAYFEGIAGGGLQRPASLELTGDGTLFVKGVQWTSWGGPEATGSGNAVYHGCTPNCAQAPVNTALVSIRLFGVRVCSGRRYYSGVTLTLNSGQLLDRDFLQRSWSPC